MKKNMKFEEAMDSLEDITAKLESGSLSLDESIEAYERAVALIKICNEKIDDAEKKVKILTVGQDGKASAVDFDSKNAD